jgi:hypothetical protein
MGRYLTLTNFGRTDGDPEEKTVPLWMLPGDRTGLPDKPDFVIIRGWPTDRALPTGPTQEVQERGITVELILAELKYTDDGKMHEKHASIVHKYAPLIARLRDAGWKVRPFTASVVVGHRSTALLINHTALNTVGAKGKKEQQRVHNSMVDVSIDYTRRIVVATRRARARQLDSTVRTESANP